MNKNTSLRLFIALILPLKTRRILAGIEDLLRKEAGKKNVKWVEKENLHQTMVFLGRVANERIKLIKKIMVTLERNPVLNLSLSKLEFFPDRQRPRIIWVALGGEKTKLSSYYHQLRLGLQRVDFDFDTRFSPHITLGRVRRGRKLVFSTGLLEKIHEVLHRPSAAFVAKKLVLFKSELKQTGPIYTPIFQIRLKG